MGDQSPPSYFLIGAGKMGSALLASWQRARIPAASIAVLESSAAQAKKLKFMGVRIFSSLDEVSFIPECIVIAVKPQSMDTLMPSLARQFDDRPLYFSIVAGKTLSYFNGYLRNTSPVVRAMPNTPALIGKGISVLCANKKVNAHQKQLATTLMKAAGEVIWLDDESLMDAVTAISGSGPAYVFLFMEALIDAGKKHGLSESVSRQLALETVAGSAELAKSSKDSLATLRKNVTSPGGTTEAALGVLMKHDALKSLMAEAVAQAVKRSKELA